MDDDEIAHLAGLFDSAGSVTVHIAEDSKYAIGYRYKPLVRVFRPKDDEATLGKLNAFAEEIGIRHHISEDRDSAVFEVSTPDDIGRFLSALYPWLTTKHEVARIMLDGVLPGLASEKHKTKQGFYELVEYADRLRGESRHGPDATYTQEFFEKEWEIKEIRS